MINNPILIMDGEHEAKPLSEMRRLLVLDCEESIRFSLKEYFTLQHYLVDTAADLDEAEKLFETKPYDVVVQDLLLGVTRNVDGLEFIRFIRGRPANTRIIVLTAYGSPEIKAAALRCGADAFLRKPKPLSIVAQVIQNLIDSAPAHTDSVPVL